VYIEAPAFYASSPPMQSGGKDAKTCQERTKQVKRRELTTFITPQMRLSTKI